MGAADLSLNLTEQPWVAAVATDAAVAASRAQQRLRPLIYVYDLPALFNSRMLEWRIIKVRRAIFFTCFLHPHCDALVIQSFACALCAHCTRVPQAVLLCLLHRPALSWCQLADGQASLFRCKPHDQGAVSMDRNPIQSTNQPITRLAPRSPLIL